MMMRLLEKIGSCVLERFEWVGSVILLLAASVKEMRRPLRPRHIFAQMSHLGVDSLAIVSLTMLFTGMVMTLQVAHEFIRFGAQSTIGGVIAIAVGRELGPVLVGVVCAGRVGSAITAEISTMKVTEQIDALRCMATNPVAYLVVPRFVACVIMVPLLTFYGYLIGTGGGYAVAIYSAGLTHFTYMHSIEFFTEVSDVLFGLIKAMVFGGIISLVACYEGMHAKSGAEGVGQATTKSVVTSIIFIFITNYILSVILY
mgnify:CR=1 FL=1